MIKKFILFLILAASTSLGYSQTIIAAWDFEDENLTIDNAGPSGMNSGKVLTTTAGGALTWPTGSGASGTSYSRDNWTVIGTDYKYFMIDISTLGYNAITVSSWHRSSNTGPREFKLQYNVGGGTWTDVTGGSYNVVNSNAGTTLNVSLPTAAQNQSSVQLRWIMSSIARVSPSSGVVANGGTSRIGDIIIRGTLAVTRTINLTDLSETSFCQDSDEHIAEFSTAGFTGSNTFTLQLSNASGSFASPATIGSLSTSAASGNLLEFDMPVTAAGSGYKVRLINAATVSNEFPLTILARPGGSILALNNTSSSDEMCPGEQAIIKFVNSGAGSLFDIKVNGVDYTSVENGDEIIVNPSLNTTTSFTLQQIINDDGCMIAIP